MEGKSIRTWVTVLLSSCLLSLLHAQQVFINEVCYENSILPDGTGNTSSDWVELYNAGVTGVNIGGWKLSDSSNPGPGKFVELPDYVLPARSMLLVFTNKDLPQSLVWINTRDIPLIPGNAVWEYYTGTPPPEEGWASGAGQWPSGPSPLGYNDPRGGMDIATALPSGEGELSYPAAAFRRTFSVPDPSLVTSLTARVRICHGARIYLNGFPIWEDNLPEGSGWEGYARSARSTLTWREISLPLEGLALGNNTLAVEIHRPDPSTGSLVFDLSLTAKISDRTPLVRGTFGFKAGENVYLFNRNGTRIHRVKPPDRGWGVNISYGCRKDGDDRSMLFFSRPTPGSPNAFADTPSVRFEADPALPLPVLGIKPGFYTSAPRVPITCASRSGTVYYTVDGSDPRFATNSIRVGSSLLLPSPPPLEGGGLSWIRTNPVEIADRMRTAAWSAPIGSVPRAVVLRAIFTQNSRCSKEVRGTYFIGGSHRRHLPVLSVTAEREALFGFRDGIYVPGLSYANSPVGYGDNRWGKPYANYHQEWERPAFLEFFEKGSDFLSFSASLGMGMHGGGTRALPQKTLYMICRMGEYGTDRINYRLFPGETATSYKRFLLRNSGNDWYGPDVPGVATLMKDAVFSRIAAPLGIAVMAYRPVSVYLNGEYWGIHNLRESYDKHYMASRYGLDPDNMDILTHEEDERDRKKVKIVRVDGDKGADEEYELMLKDIELNHPVSTGQGYTNLASRIDIGNYTDYIIAETFFANTDWPANNCDFWRAHTNQVAQAGAYGDGRWRWMLYDLDVAGERGADYNMFTYLSDRDMTGDREPGFLINQLWSNADYRTAFVARYTELLNTVFTPGRMERMIRAAAADIEPEIEAHFRRWGRTTTAGEWRRAVDTALVSFTAARYRKSWDHLNAHFGLGGYGVLTLSNADPSGTGGSFRVNGLNLIPGQCEGVESRADWSGRFFRNLPVEIEALPDPGYLFDGWVGSPQSPSTRTLTLPPGRETLLKARFRRAGEPPFHPEGYEAWMLENYGEQEILEGTRSAPDALTPCAGLSNFALYAFGMSLHDGLTDEQRRARLSLSIRSHEAELWLGYSRLPAPCRDVDYRLKVSDSLAPANWREMVPGVDYRPGVLTNGVDSPLWRLEVPLVPAGGSRFYRLETRKK